MQIGEWDALHLMEGSCSACGMQVFRQSFIPQLLEIAGISFAVWCIGCFVISAANTFVYPYIKASAISGALLQTIGSGADETTQGWQPWSTVTGKLVRCTPGGCFGKAVLDFCDIDGP